MRPAPGRPPLPCTSSTREDPPGAVPTPMWNHIGPRNLIHMQMLAAIASLDREIADDHQAGYCVDELLDRRADLVTQIKQAQA